MSTKVLQIFLFLLVIAIDMSAQVRECDSDVYLQAQVANNPRRLEIINQIERHTEQYLMQTHQRSVSLVTIPVVVHIVYNNIEENVSDAQVASQLAVLNEDFRRLNKDANNNWSQGSDTEIEFCLATVDPQGKPTSGITRTYTYSSSFSTSTDYVKYTSAGGKDAWPADQYLNMWVADISGTVLGYAQFPGGSSATDGVVIDYKCFGTGPTTNSPFNLGRTATHEVGHWLNLKHIWGSADCVTDDLVSDTPNSDGPNYGCNKGHRSCSTTDMVENYMDYSDDACMNLFTAGQKSRMKALFSVGGFRHNILNSKACGLTTTTTTENVACGQVNINILFDNYPQETSWYIKDAKGATIITSPKYFSSQKGQTISVDSCLAAGCYEFVISDTYSDGICCKYGSGKYTFTANNKVIASGGDFGKVANHTFCIEVSTQPTCTDGIKNGGETGIDCGGSICIPCPTCTDGVKNGSETDIDCGGPDCIPCTIEGGTDDTGGSNTSNSDDGYFFENGWDGWTGGDSDTERYQGDFAWEGDFAIMLRDNSGDLSSIFSPIYDLRGFQQVKIDFAFYAYSMEGGEDFWLSYFDGIAWRQLKAYVSGVDFYNSTFYEVSFVMNASQYSFVQAGQFKFQCDASTNSDQIYIDAIQITPLTGGQRMVGNLDKISSVGFYIGDQPEEAPADAKIYPNPSNGSVHIEANVDMQSIKVYDMNGALIKTINISSDYHNTDFSDLEIGVYLINIQTDDATISKKFIKSL